jgi:hypothetical protein
MNHATGCVIFELAFYRHDLAHFERHGPGDIDVGLDAHEQITLLVEFEQEAFVFAARTAARAKHAEYGSTADHFGTTRTAGIERADLRVIGLLCLPAAARRAAERECKS